MSAVAEPVESAVDCAVPAAVGRKNPPPGLKPFQYRDDKGVIRTLPKPDEKPPEPVLSNETHPLADVIDWVITRSPDDDYTHEQKFYRGIKDERPAEFAKMREQFKRVAAAPESSPDAPAEAPFPELEEAWASYLEWHNARS